MPRTRSGSLENAELSAPALAKLSAPRLRKVVRRERLFSLIDDEAAAIVWVHAPPGSGKTTLAASYLESRQQRAIWYQLDGNDRDAARLFADLSVAATRFTRRKLLLPVFDPAQRLGWAAFAREFARAWFALLPPGTVLVFDNAQEASGPEFDQLLEIFWEALPPDRGMWVLSHLAPPQGFSVRQIKGQAQVVNLEQLLFTVDEADSLIRELKSGRQAVANIQVDELVSRTRGWAAGLVVIAAQDELGSREAGASEPAQLFDYFAHAVFSGLPPAQQEILAQLSILPWFTTEMAARLSGAAAPQVVEDVFKRALFLERRALEGGGAVYQFHPLFRAYLSRELERRANADSVHQLRGVAATLLHQLGHADLAVRIHVANGDVRAASGLLCDEAPGFLRRGLHALFVELARDCLGPASGVEAPVAAWLHFWRGLANAPSDEVASRQDFESAFARFKSLQDSVGMVVSAAAVIQALTEGWRNFAGVEQWAQELEAHYSEQMQFPSQELELVAVSGVFSTTITVMSSRFEEHALARLLQLVESEVDNNLRLVACLLALPRLQMTGKLEIAATLINSAAHLAAQPGITEFRRASWLQMRAFFHFLAYSIHGKGKKELEQGERALKEATELATRFRFEGILFRAEWLDAENALMRGELDLCEAKIVSAEHWLSPNRPANLLSFYLLKAHLACFRGNYVVARHEIRAAVQAGKDANFPSRMLRPYRWSEAQILAGLGDFAGAREAGEFALSHAQGAYRDLHATGLLIFEALEMMAQIKQQPTPEREAQLKAMLVRILEKIRLHRFFAICGLLKREMAMFCSEALRLGVDQETVVNIIQKRGYSAPDPSQEEWPFRIRVRVFGGFHLEIDGQAFASAGKAQRKPLELLQALAARGTQAYAGVPVDTLIDELWPSLEADDPKGSFDTALHRLRKLLDSAEGVLLSDGKLRFHRDLVWCDTDAFERLVEQGESAVGTDWERLAQRIGNLYRGPLHQRAGERDQLFRERYRARFVATVLRLGARLEQQGLADQALALYEQGLAQDDLVEDFYRAQMRIFIGQGRQSDALRVYRRCKDMLSVVLGVAPSADTEALRRQI